MMTRRRSGPLFIAPVLVSLALFAGPAAAQAPSAAPEPEEQPGAPPGAPGEVDPNAPLPPGHPPLEGGGNRGGMPDLPQDAVRGAPDLPAGSVRVVVVDPEGAAMPSMQVRLGIQRQSVEQGDQKDLKLVVSDQEGKSRFDGLSTGSRYNYRANVEHDGAAYASETFSLREDMGMEVRLHVFPATSDIRRAMIATQAIAVISPRDDVFQFEVLFRVYNASKVTWVPRDVVIDMPTGFKAFTAEEGMSDTRAVAEGTNAVRLAGTYSPGQHEVTFRFQVPNDGDPDVSFRMGLPPHTGEVRVIAEAARGMSMNVDGFGAAETTVGEDGRPLLVTGRRIQNGQAQMPDVTVRLTGIPTPPPGRWYAIVLAGLFVAGGFSSALGEKKQKGTKPVVNPEDARRAKELLLEELASLERAYRAKDVGPRTYETARRALVDALARLETQLPKSTKKRAATGRPARA